MERRYWKDGRKGRKIGNECNRKVIKKGKNVMDG